MDNRNTVIETCKRFAEIARYDLKHLNVAGAFERIAELQKREIVEKDSEIARLKQEVENGIGDFAKAVGGMAKRDALIKELADAMCKNCRNHTVDCWTRPCDFIKKAREVVK